MRFLRTIIVGILVVGCSSHPLVGEAWTGPDGEVLDEGVVRTGTGDAHCDLDDVVFLSIPAEAVDVPAGGEKRATYIRDPGNDVPDTYVAGRFHTLEELPVHAEPLGYTTPSAQLMSVGEDTERILVVFDDENVESWARLTDVLACA